MSKRNLHLLENNTRETLVIFLELFKGLSKKIRVNISCLIKLVS